MRVLLDTCVLIDYTAARPDYAFIKQLIFASLFGDIEIWVSAKSYTDLFYCMNRMAGANRQTEQASDAIQEAILAGLNYFNVCSVTKECIETAAKEKWPDFEDCLMSVNAQRIKADYIVTRDIKGFVQSPIPTISPKELFERFKALGIEYEEIDINEN